MCRAGGTHYEALGLAQSATDAEIKSAFRRLAKAHHPDVSNDVRPGEDARPSRTLVPSGTPLYCWHIHAAVHPMQLYFGCSRTAPNRLIV